MPPIHKLPALLKEVSSETIVKPLDSIMTTQPDTEPFQAYFRIGLAWMAYFFGSITLQNVGVTLAIIFTFLQILALLRREFGFFRPKEPK